MASNELASLGWLLRVENITKEDGHCNQLPSVLQILKVLRPFDSMAQQGSDALNRTFTELKAKDEDRRRQAAYDLYQLVSTAARGKSFKPLLVYKLMKYRAISGRFPSVLQQRQSPDNSAHQ